MVSRFLKNFDIADDLWAIVVCLLLLIFAAVYFKTNSEFAKDLALQFSGAFMALILPGNVKAFSRQPPIPFLNRYANQDDQNRP